MVGFTSIRSRFKAGLEVVIARSGLAGMLRRRLRHRGVILAYHGIVPHGERPAGELSLHLAEDQFVAQLSVLGELAEVVSLRDLLRKSPLPGGGAARPRVAITWDDAYHGALTSGLDAVIRHGFPATIFVAPGRLGGQSFWWDRLAQRFNGMIPVEVRARVLQELAGEDEQVAAIFEPGAVSPDMPQFARSAEESLLAVAASRSGVSVASHSWSHPNLAAVTADRLERELTQSAHWLRERFDSYMPFVAYPYGLHSPEVRQGSSRAGYVAGLRIDGGWMPRDGTDQFRVPRLNVPAGLSLDGFVLRLSGLLAR